METLRPSCKSTFKYICLLLSAALKFSLKSIPKGKIFLKQAYCNDNFKLVKLEADSFLIEVVFANPGSFICYYKSWCQSLRIEAAFAITHPGSGYYESVQLLQIRTDLLPITAIITNHFTTKDLRVKKLPNSTLSPV